MIDGKSHQISLQNFPFPARKLGYSTCTSSWAKEGNSAQLNAEPDSKMVNRIFTYISIQLQHLFDFDAIDNQQNEKRCFDS